MTFFTDRELGKTPPTKNEIDINVWNGIVGIIEASIANNYFAKSFPETCPDGMGISGVNQILFYDKVKALIPQIEIPISRKDAHALNNGINTFSVLDLIEFCYQNTVDSEITGKFHDYFNHYHLKFNTTSINKQQLQTDINQLFERNGIAYLLDDSGKIVRVIPQEFQQIINRSVATQDPTLNGLIDEAKHFILLPNPADRSRALEKVWDAFERVKTYYGHNKRLSAEQLLSTVASGNVLFQEYLGKEATTLTEIGNKFQIRHFEADRQPITDLAHVDYLFFRMFALIDLFVKKLEE